MPSSHLQSGPSPVAAVGHFFWELIKIFLIAVTIIVPVRYFLVQPFFVRGASMEPNFEDGEYLIIDEISYRFREPERGEVIVFNPPDNPSQYYIKRVVGVPGDTVTITDGRVVVQNSQFQQGAVLDETLYLPPSTRTGGAVLPLTLGPDEYFVLGDNRAASSDSRYWGVLAGDMIIGRAWIRAYPVDRFDLFSLERPGFVAP